MSANRSQRQIRADIMAAPTARYATWELAVTCGPCDRAPEFVPVSLLGSGLIGLKVSRLRCSRCGMAPSEVLITNGLQGWRQVTLRLVGSGSYA